MIQRVYIDTSVIGGCFDAEFNVDSNALIEEIRNGEKIAMISDILLFELEEAPEEVKKVIDDISEEHKEYVSLDEGSLSLSEAYINEGAVAEGSLSDARHIAIATVGKADVRVSWNCKHIVNIHRIHLLNSVNLKLGYHILEIRSPKEVLNG